MARIIRRRKVSGRRRGGKRRLMKRRMNLRRKNLNAMKDNARVVEAQEEIVVSGANNAGWVTHTLSAFPRALAVSKQYRFYRCTRVEVEFVPFANLYTPGTSFPELYYQVDRTQSTSYFGVTQPLPSKAIMLSRGVLPVKWTNMIKRYYNPSVLRNENFIQNVQPDNFVSSIAAVTSTPVMNKWYATQQFFSQPPGAAASPVEPTWSPSLLTYFGAAYFVDSPVPVSGNIGTIKIRTHWEFKEPFVAAQPSSVGDESGTIPQIAN